MTFRAILLATALLAGANPITTLVPPAHAATTESGQRGALIGAEPLGIMPVASAAKQAASVDKAITVSNAVALYRLTYWTRLRGKSVKASGLFAAPLGVAAPKGVVAYFRGSNTASALAPSQPRRIDGNSEAAVFGGTGHYVIVPDYVGMGVSSELQSFVLTEPSVDAATDMMRAAHSLVTERRLPWNSDLFMFGFSQGGHLVAAMHRELERTPLRGFNLRASAGVAGPYELRQTSLTKALDSNCMLCVGYVAWITQAYAQHYGQPLDTMLKPQFAASVPHLFNGSNAMDQMIPHLLTNVEGLLQAQFHAELRANKDNWFTRALDANEAYRWTPKAPFRIYYGDADADVPAAASLAFYNHAKPRGGNVSLHPMGDTDHMATMQRAYPDIRNWFDSID
jgi:Secretory lipase